MTTQFPSVIDCPTTNPKAFTSSSAFANEQFHWQRLEPSHDSLQLNQRPFPALSSFDTQAV